MSALKNYMDSEGPEIKVWQWFFTFVIIIILVVIGIVVFGNPQQKEQETDERYCTNISRYEPVSELPAMCLKYVVNAKVQ